MNFSKIILFTISLFLFAGGITAQNKTKSLEGINSILLKNMGAIKDNEEVVGYYFFYEVDKIDRKTRAYRLKIVDNNLEEISSKKIKSGKYTSLIDARFNGKHIMLKFYEGKEKKYSFKTYAMDGKMGKGASRKLGKKTYNPPLYMQSKRGENHSDALFPIPGKGFVNYASIKNKKRGYIIDFIGQDNQWKYKSSKTSKLLEFTQFIAADENILLSNLIKFKNGWGKDGTNSILAIDINTGEKVFEKVLHETKPVSILNGFIDQKNDEIVIFGIYYKEKAKVHKAKSLGIYIGSFDLKGNKKQDKFLSWEKGAKNFLQIDKKGKMKRGRYLAFHDIVRASDGKIIVLGEQFRKQVDGGAILAGALGARSRTGGLNMSKLMIENFVVFQLNSALEVENLKVFEKEKSSAKTFGMGWESPQLMAYLAKAQGAFDYAFTQKNEDRSAISFGYIDWEKRKGEKDGYTFGAINYVDGEFTKDKLPLSGKATSIRILPGPIGYVLVAEYYKKDKKMDLRLEKINL